MIRLLKIELAKILPYRVFWIVTLVYVAVLMGASKLSHMTFNGIQAPSDTSTLLWAAGYVNQAVLGYLAILLVCNEFENRTLKQHVIDGLGRADALFAKGLLFLVFIFLSLILVFSLAAFSEDSTRFSDLATSDLFLKLAFFAFRSFAFLSLALFISVFFRKSAPSLGIYFLWPLLIEPVLGWVGNKYWEGFQDVLPTVLFSQLLRSPFAGSAPPQVPLTIYLAAAGYTAVLWFLSLTQLNRRDL